MATTKDGGRVVDGGDRSDITECKGGVNSGLGIQRVKWKYVRKVVSVGKGAIAPNTQVEKVKARSNQVTTLHSHKLAVRLIVLVDFLISSWTYQLPITF